MKHQLHVLLSLLFCASSSFSVAEALETDDAYHIEHVKRPDFIQADTNKDGVINIADRGGWWHNRHHDINKDGKVEFAEYANHYEDTAAARVLRNVVYKTATGQKCLLDIYIPAKQKSPCAPVFYYTHGGGWVAGNKDQIGSLKRVFDGLLAEGIVCVSASYRLVKTRDQDDPVVMSDCVTDAKDGLRFLRKHAAELGIDAARMMPFGLSAGGHISLLLTDSDPADFPGDPDLADFPVQPVAGISWFGPADFTVSDLFVPDVAGWKGNPDRFTPRMSKNTGGLSYQQADDELKAIMRKLSPVYYLKKNSPPVLTMHGDKDDGIPSKHSAWLRDKATAIGASVKYILVKNAGHGWHKDSDPNADEIAVIMMEFAVKHLSSEGRQDAPHNNVR